MPTSKSTSRVILGIDPGYADTGYGVIERTRSSVRYITCGTISTKKNMPFGDRLVSLADAFDTLIRKYSPAVIAVEKIFFAQNQKTAIDVAQARGIIIMYTARQALPLMEFTPLQVKQRLTAYGHADKRQVARMVMTLLRLRTLKEKNDAIDALAVALCASFERSIIG
ncbi:MAG: crossover junction endodeoxyribonuclease RuvC [Candidatus Komeilibacteria bacterium RIFCSPLOWO2_01_FULL_53_11]|uniref:Crossover junction endodeoxyribonuclease RuvC n=1 Tax=Candidatus Komeilibacteria bacterium RIFCSPLOWO2_01_FULL_53_11 TaxID=1798552 RepID=A0A1G2BUH1_9BACT|nr:MAG: crossover junction endodeoxyribonuclease RuvC [Candidatus Komeilibacteria bacterium RIFCSPLOWO2_01_FULL_53_11]